MSANKVWRRATPAAEYGGGWANFGIDNDDGTFAYNDAGTVRTVVDLSLTQTLTNKTLTSPVVTTPQINDTSADHQYVFAVSELTADRTVTLPLLTAADTFVFATFTQTLTNKTLTSPVLTTPQINDTSADHQYIFGVSELTADRTVTMPLLTGNDTFVFNDFTQTLTNKTLTSPKILTSLVFDETTNDLTMTSDDQAIAAGTVNWPDIGGVNSGAVVSAAIKFDVSQGHATAVGTSTGTVELPAGAVLLNIQIVTTVLWNAGTNALMDVGDDDDADGWFAAVSLKATDQLVGEVLDISNAENWGGKNGVYLVAATGVKGRVTAGVDSGVYYGAITEVVGKIVTTGTVPTTGTTYMIVTWMKPTQTAAAYAAT